MQGAKGRASVPSVQGQLRPDCQIDVSWRRSRPGTRSGSIVVLEPADLALNRATTAVLGFVRRRCGGAG
jgi:hypothetical protein